MRFSAITLSAADVAGWSERRRHVTAGILLVTAWIFFTTEMIVVRILTADYAVAQMAAVRTGAQAILFAAIGLATGWAIARTVRIPMHGLRALCSQIGMILYYYAFAVLPLAVATTLTFTQAMFLLVLAVLFLGERVRWRRITAVLAGFAGVLIVLRPGFETVHPAMIGALVGAFVSATLLAITRSLSLTDGRWTVMFWASMIGTLLAAIPAAIVWVPIAPEHWPLFLAVSASGIVGQFLMVGAFQLAEASALAPVDYVRLVFAIAAGYLLFQEIPDLWTLVGSAIVLGSAATIVRRTRAVRAPGSATPAA